MDDKDFMLPDEEYVPGNVGRWLPATVVLAVVCGFMTLAWYAYHAGTQAVKDDELLVVEADKTPVKEKPADPGGMQFPGQDKTVFDAFSGNTQAPAKVERVLPSPEEPMPKEAENAAPPVKELPAQAEQVIGEPKPVESIAKVEEAPHQIIEEKPVEAAKIDTASENGKLSPASGKASALPSLVEHKPAAPTPQAKKIAADAGAYLVQLGAYRSDAEAHAAWKKIQKQHPALSGHEPSVVKADLGQRGVYYRLRAGGFADAGTAKGFCQKLSGAGQACMTVANK